MELPTERGTKMFMWEEVAELKAYYEEKCETEKVKECEVLLELYKEMKMHFDDWREMKRLAQQNKIRKNIGEFAMYK